MHPCARCATLQRTCCQQAEVVVTDGDIARIRTHTGSAAFWERRAPTDPADAVPDPEDPNWARWTIGRDGRRQVLARRADGSCGFLGTAGCTLPEDTRPLICRLYPFHYTERGLADEESAHYCPTAAVGVPGRPMADVLGMPRDTAAWHVALLYAELRDGGRRHADRTDLRPAG